MTTFDYTKTRDTAERLLTRFGAAGVIRRITVTGGDPWNPGSGTPTTVNHAATMVVTDYAAREIDGTVILATDRKVLVSTSGLSITPATSDLVVLDGQTLAIVSVKPLKPAGTVVMYELQCRA